jgi:hypothetical protein
MVAPKLLRSVVGRVVRVPVGLAVRQPMVARKPSRVVG